MERESTALKLLMLISLDQLVQGLLFLRSRRDTGLISPTEIMQLMMMEKELDFLINDIGSSPDDFSLIGRA
jgi:hypothetical protein